MNLAFQPDVPTQAMADMHATLELVDDLVEGVDAVRARAEVYIPRAPDEIYENWLSKINKAALVNFYEKALDAAQGAAFSKPAEVKHFPGQLSPLLRDIDGSGSTFEMFAQESFWQAVHHGISYILADYPNLQGQVRTLKDKRALNARPYLTHIDASQVVAAYAAYDDGSERMTHFRFVTNEVVPADDFMSETVVKVVVSYSQQLRNGPVVLTRYTQDTSGTWDVEERILPIPVIPVVPQYAWRTGFCTGKPTLHVLARANIEHFRLATTHAAGLEIACIPFLHAAGPSLNTARKNDTTGEVEQQKFTLTPYKAAVTDESTIIKWVEAEGSGLSMASDHMRVLEDQMAMMGLTTFLTNQPGGKTATEVAINTAQSSAQLRAIALSFAQGLSRALWILALYEGVDAPNVEVTLDASFAVDAPPQPEQPQRGSADGSFEQVEQAESQPTE
jgi:hypothetical protein